MAIGSELLQGFLIDTNSAFLAQELTALGIEVIGVNSVGDDEDSIVRAMTFALENADVLVCTGGIGPTSDDLSREAVARICNEQPTVDPAMLAEVETFFTRRGARMPERNAKQAWLIPSATPLRNAVGTAPGWYVQTSGKTIVLMPGVPREMMPMWQQEVVPQLLPAVGGESIVSRTLKTIGIGESAVEEELREFIDCRYPVVSTYAKNDGVHVRVLAIAADEQTATAAVSRTVSDIRSILGDAVYGELDTSLPESVLRPLLDNDHSLAIVEVGAAAQVVSLFASDMTVNSVIKEASVFTHKPVDNDGKPVSIDVLVANARENSKVDAALGVEITLGKRDRMDRFDAWIDIVVSIGDETRRFRHAHGARIPELGRRASLLAAEDLRRVLLDSRLPL